MNPVHMVEQGASSAYKPVVITGGAGFIGCNLARSFLVEGQPVRIVDNLSRSGVEQNLAWLRQEFGPLLSFAKVDTGDCDTIAAHLTDGRAVFHFAAQTAVTTSLDDPMDDFRTNAQGTLNVLEAIRAQPTPPSLVFTSTNKVYGDLADLQLGTAEDRYWPTDAVLASRGIGEDRGLDFCTPYGCSKGVADQYVLDYASSYGLPTAVLRMSCIYGPRQFGTEDQGWVAHFLIKALQGERISVYGDGRQVRDVLFVDDAVAAYRAVLANIDLVKGRAFNLGGGPENAVSVRQVLDEIQMLVGHPLRTVSGDWRRGDQLYFVASTAALQKDVGWTAKVGWRDGIRRLRDWLVANRNVARPRERVSA